MSKIRTIPLPLLLALLLVACDSPRSSDSAPLSDEQPDAGGQLPDTAEINRELMTAAANGDVATTLHLLAQGADRCPYGRCSWRHAPDCRCLPESCRGGQGADRRWCRC